MKNLEFVYIDMFDCSHGVVAFFQMYRMIRVEIGGISLNNSELPCQPLLII